MLFFPFPVLVKHLDSIFNQLTFPLPDHGRTNLVIGGKFGDDRFVSHDIQQVSAIK
jgi:hypothetical protein